LRFLGRKFDYYPWKDAQAAWQVDSSMDAMGDLMTALIGVHFEADEEKKKELAQKLLTVTAPKWCSVMEARIKNNSNPGHLVGDKWTIADFQFAAILSGVVYNEVNEKAKNLRAVFDQYPGLVQYWELVSKDMKEYLDARPKRPM